jgi:hypothetical protein
MEYNDLVCDAIEDYNIFTKSQKKILKSLIKLSVNNKVVVTIPELMKINCTTRATVATALDFFKQNSFINMPDLTGIRFSYCTLNVTKLDEIIKHHQNKIKILK